MTLMIVSRGKVIHIFTTWSFSKFHHWILVIFIWSFLHQWAGILRDGSDINNFYKQRASISIDIFPILNLKIRLINLIR